MGIYRSEFLKVISKKLFVTAVVSAAVFNFILCLWSSNQEMIDANEYKQLYQKIHTMGDDYEQIYVLLRSNQEMVPRDNYVMQLMYRNALYNLESITTYEDFLEGIQTRADKITDISIFARKESFTYRSAMKTPPAYEHLKGNILQFGNSQTLTFATSRDFTDLFAVLLLFLVSTILVLYEKEKGLFSLLRSTKRGRIHLLGAKLAVLYTFGIIIYLILYSGNIIASYHLYGKMYGSRLIQSVEGFLGSTLQLSIVGYLILYSVTKILAYFFIGGLFVLICVIARTGVIIYGITVCFTILGYLLYRLIQNNSYLSIAKYVNIFSVLHTNEIYRNYLNINFFGYPINILHISAFLLIPGNLIIFLLCLFIFARHKNMSFSSSKVLEWLRNHIPFRNRISSHLLGYEGYKIFIINKAFFIICVIGLLCYYNYQNYRMPYIQYDGLYKYYMKQVEGVLTPQTYEFMEEEQRRFDELRSEIALVQSEFQSGNMNIVVYDHMMKRINQELQLEIGLVMLRNKVNELEVYFDSDSKIKPWLVYDTGYLKLLGIYPDNHFNISHLIFILGMITCIAPIYSIENTVGANHMIRPTLKGRKHSLLTRMTLGFFITLILFIIVYIPGIITILSNYGTSGIHAPMISLSGYHNFPLSLSINKFIGFLYGIRFLFAFIMMNVILGISYLSPNVTSAFVISSGLFVIPFVIALLGFSFVQAVFFNPFLFTYLFFMDKQTAIKSISLFGNLMGVLLVITIFLKRTYHRILTSYE